MINREDKPSARHLYQPEYRRAAELLLDIAGPASEHIRMNEREGKKYYTNLEPLTLQHMVAHLDGRRTYGALIGHPDGMTRASIYDADTPETVAIVKEAAQHLWAAGYKPLIELSPAGKAHLVIIYAEHVNARAAHYYECKIAPELENIKEYWPSSSRNKVRLPAGKYVRSGIAGWCKLYDADGQELAQNERSAVHVLLEYQTPASIVPPLPEPYPSQPPSQVQLQEHSPRSTKGDERYRAKYDQSRLWVAFTPQQLIDRFNQQYSIEDLAAYERNGMILADWRGERTASVGVTKDGQHWVDFGASARSLDGKQDGGDAFELYVRKSGRAKNEVLRELGQILNREASRELLRAARAGEVPVAWVAEMMTPTGWRVYNENREKAGHTQIASEKRNVGLYRYRPDESLDSQRPQIRRRSDQMRLYHSHGTRTHRFSELCWLMTLTMESRQTAMDGLLCTELETRRVSAQSMPLKFPLLTIQLKNAK
jgi:hypothetical protein